ncbi:hypothetical protein SF83666_c37410 [Sinorhizobium fredii CCBAU 83666]|nr:hypothetical protein SF83666_c37410 [Sinorhizobium fredii CCBAU 83666]
MKSSETTENQRFPTGVSAPNAPDAGKVAGLPLGRGFRLALAGLSSYLTGTSNSDPQCPTRSLSLA